MKAMQQKERKVPKENNETIRTQVSTLKEIGMVREVDYPTWLSNMESVKKPYGIAWMCIAFTNVNDAFPKKCYPLPIIDQLVDVTIGFGLFSYLGSYSSYHQIRMHSDDEEKFPLSQRRVYDMMLRMRTDESCQVFGVHIQGEKKLEIRLNPNKCVWCKIGKILWLFGFVLGN